MVTNQILKNPIYTVMLTTNFFEKKRDLFLKIKSKCYVLVNIFKNKFNKNKNYINIPFDTDDNLIVFTTIIIYVYILLNIPYWFSIPIYPLMKPLI